LADPPSPSTPPATPVPAAPAAPPVVPAPKVAKPRPAKAAPKPAAAAASRPATKAAGAPVIKVVAPKPAPAPPTGTVIDVSGLVLGRASSVIAKRLLKGERIIIVNAERSVVTGNRSNIISFYTANRARGSVRSGPHFPRYPDRIFRRTVRGMLPHLKTRGKEALERLDVYIGVPPNLSGAPRQSIELAKVRPSLRPPLSLEEITRLLGARL
jgi:large subunit ribosomal protein L13